jgi:pimeloyl-ACP methyl ester carboxylesterase
MGAIKAILTLAGPRPPQIARLVAISPPRLSYSHFCTTPRADEFLRTFATAQQCIDQGRGEELLLIQFPIPYYVSAAGFVDRYGPEEKYNVLKLLDRVSCPTLVTYGSSEVRGQVAFRGMPEAVARLATAFNSLQVAVIAGADHIYTGLHDALAARIASWLRRKQPRELE